MRLLFYDWRNPVICTLGIVFFTLLVLVSAEEEQSSATGIYGESTLSADVDTTTKNAIEPSNAKKETCTNNKYTVEQFMNSCKDEPFIIVNDFLLDMSKYEESTINDFLSTKTRIITGGIKLYNNAEIKKLNVSKLQILMKGLEIVNTNLEHIEFFETNITNNELHISGKTKVRGNRYLNQTVLHRIKSASESADVQEEGECVVDPKNPNLKNCTRVYGDLELDNVNISKIAPDFQPIAISGCLKIHKNVTFPESIFEKLIENSEIYKNNNTCKGASYVDACVLKSLHENISKAFPKPLRTYDGSQICEFTCKMEDITTHNQTSCKIIEGDVIINTSSNFKSDQMKYLHTVEIIRGKLVINGTRMREIIFPKLASIESNEESALVITNNVKLKPGQLKFLALNKITAKGTKDWVIIEGNGYRIDTQYGKFLENVGDDENLLKIDRVETTTQKPETTESGGNVEKQASKDDNKANTGIGTKEEEESNSKTIGIIVGIVVVILIVLVVGGAVGLVIFLKKRKAKKEKKAEKIKPRPKPKLQKKESMEAMHTAKEEKTPAKGENTPGKEEKVEPPVIPVNKDDWIIWDEETQIPSGSSIVERIFNLVESILNMPVLPFRVWIMNGISSSYETNHFTHYKHAPLMGDYLDRSSYDQFMSVLEYCKFSHCLVTQFFGSRAVENIKEHFNEMFKADPESEHHIFAKPKKPKERKMVICGVGMSKLKEKLEKLGIDKHFDFEEQKCETKKEYEKPHPLKDVEVSFYKVTTKASVDHNGRDIKPISATLEVHNYITPENPEWIAENVDHFTENLNLIKLLHWAYINNAGVVCQIENLFPLVQMLSFAIFFVFDYDCCTTIDIELGSHLNIVTFSMMRLKFPISQKVSTLSWDHYPPEAGHAYAIQVLKYLRPYVEEKQKTDDCYGGICIKDFNATRDEYMKNNAGKLPQKRKKFVDLSVSFQYKTERKSLQKDEPKREAAGKDREPKAKTKSGVKSVVKSAQGSSQKKSQIKSHQKSAQKSQQQKPDKPKSVIAKSKMGTASKMEKINNCKKTMELVDKYLEDTAKIIKIVKEKRVEYEEIDWEETWKEQADLLAVLEGTMENIELDNEKRNKKDDD